MAKVFDTIGGPVAVSTAVNVLYEKLLADPALRHFFDDVDLDALRRHQRDFLGAVLGGPDVYRGRDLRAAHAARGIDDAAYDGMVAHLMATLRGLGVNEVDIDEVGHAVEAFRGQVVGEAGS